MRYDDVDYVDVEWPEGENGPAVLVFTMLMGDEVRVALSVSAVEALIEMLSE